MKGKIWDGAKWLWKEFGEDALDLGKKWVKPASQFAAKPPKNPPKISVSGIKKVIAKQKPKAEEAPDWSPSTGAEYARHSKTSSRIKQELASGKTGSRPAPRRGTKKPTEDPEGLPPEITGYEGMKKGGSVRKKRYARGGGIRKPKQG